MKFKRISAFGFAIWISAAFAGAAQAGAFEDYCNVSGFAAPVRQTILILDEHHVYGENGNEVDPRNLPWRKFIGNLLISDESLIEQNFLPRERVTITLARKDGAGTRTLFSGCMPFFSPPERGRIQKDSGLMQSVNGFFGTGPIASAKRGMSLFQSRLGDSIRESVQPSMLSPQDMDRRGTNLVTSGLATSLKQNSVVNLSYGVPRVIVFSDMSRFLTSAGPDRSKARQAGFEMAHKLNLNLQGAEVYVIGMSGSSVSHDALEAFFLASHGELVATGSANSVPAFRSAPVRVGRYQGLIQYPDNRFPIRIRLAIDQNGTVVNSWVSVQASGEQFSPFHGVVTCEPDAVACNFTGDDIFAQVWNPSRAEGAEPIFDRALPFAGARIFSFRFDGNWIKGNISDTLVHFQGLKSYKLEFTAARSNSSQF